MRSWRPVEGQRLDDFPLKRRIIPLGNKRGVSTSPSNIPHREWCVEMQSIGKSSTYSLPTSTTIVEPMILIEHRSSEPTHNWSTTTNLRKSAIVLIKTLKQESYQTLFYLINTTRGSGLFLSLGVWISLSRNAADVGELTATQTNEQRRCSAYSWGKKRSLQSAPEAGSLGNALGGCDSKHKTCYGNLYRLDF